MEPLFCRTRKMLNKTSNAMKNPMSRLLIVLPLLAGLAGSLTSCEEQLNQAPECAITSPEDGERISIGGTGTIEAQVEDANANLQEVRFYVDGSGVGSASEFPFSPENKIKKS